MLNPCSATPRGISHCKGAAEGSHPPGGCGFRRNSVFPKEQEIVRLGEPADPSRGRKNSLPEGAVREDAREGPRGQARSVDGRCAEGERARRRDPDRQLQNPDRAHQRLHLHQESQPCDSGGEPDFAQSDGVEWRADRAGGHHGLRQSSGTNCRRLLPARGEGIRRGRASERNPAGADERRDETLDRQSQVSR